MQWILYRNLYFMYIEKVTFSPQWEWKELLLFVKNPIYATVKSQKLRLPSYPIWDLGCVGFNYRTIHHVIKLHHNAAKCVKRKRTGKGKNNFNIIYY